VPMNAGVHGCEINMGSSGKPICRLSRNHWSVGIWFCQFTQQIF
jgi:hypothetical protein